MRLKMLWNLPGIRRQFAITVLAVIVYRLASHIPLPGISAGVLARIPETELASSQLFRFADLVAGGAISRASIVALSIYPFMTAFGTLEMLRQIFPRLDEWHRYHYRDVPVLVAVLTLVFAVLGAVSGDGVILPQMGAAVEGVLARFTTIVTLTAGAMFTMWLAWWINADGLGGGVFANGFNLIVMTNILSTAPLELLRFLPAGTLRFSLLLVVLVLLLIPVLVVQNAARHVTVIYPQRRPSGMRMMPVHESYIPIPLVPGGMDALDMVYALAAFGGLVTQVVVTRFPAAGAWLQELTAKSAVEVSGFPVGEAVGAVGILLGVVAMTSLQAGMDLDAEEISDRLRISGAHIPNVRQGEQTVHYLGGIIRRVSRSGAIFMGLYCILPWVLKWALGLPAPVFVVWFGWSICRVMTDYAAVVNVQIKLYGDKSMFIQ